LLDDELPGLAYLKMLCEQIDSLEVVRAFNNPATLVAELPGIDFDICILDIEMPGINGLQVAGQLRGKPVIFTTAYKEYAADAFDLDAVDYVRKPFQIERLEQAVEKAAKKLQQGAREKSFAQFNTDKGKAIIFFDQLCLLQSSSVDPRDKVATLSDGSILTLKNISFEKLQVILPDHKFCRVNKQAMINIRFVKLFSSDEITMSIPENDHFLKISLSDAYRSEFIRNVKG
jgi:DNA-binding LytR/AlgR family response regulator